MKYIFIAVLQFSYMLPNQHVQRLSGKYLMIYEKSYSSEDCVIIFNDSTYSKSSTNKKVITGTVFYNKFHVSLIDDKSKLQMNFIKKEIMNDTIYFGTISLNTKTDVKSSISINSGKLIKIN